MFAVMLLLLLLLSICGSGSHNIVQLVHGSMHGGEARSLQSVGQVDQFILYNAQTDQPLLTLTDGMVVNIATLNANTFNIVATTVNGVVGSVKFGYNGNANARIESLPPYSLCGDSNANYEVCTYLVVGSHTITATSYSGTKAGGTIGSVKTLTFQIVNNNNNTPTPPVKSPTKAPTTPPIKSPTKAPTTPPVISPTIEQGSCAIPKVI